MKTASVQRFAAVEVVYHAIQLVLYLALFISGGIILFQRIFVVEKLNSLTLSNIHRLAGILLIAFIIQTIIISIFSKNFRVLWETLREAFSWCLRDIIWLIKVPAHVFASKVTLPPSGRFNPGQKSHLLIIFLVLLISAFTGLMIIFVPGAIGAWVAHTLCFFPALLFLCIHIFLSLINPPTNKALKGIITGYVPLDYARKHHSLWQKSKDTIPHAKHFSLWAVIITTSGLAAVVTGAIWYAGFDQVKSQISKVAYNNGREAILPGMLVLAHDEESDTKQCTSCHNYLSPPPSTKCLKCHEEIQAVMDSSQGYHGTLRGQCRTCHAEHEGLTADISSLDSKAFNHENARYSLEGKHNEAECAKCHEIKDRKTKRTKMKYIGLEFETCLKCHQNPHPNLKDNDDCLPCHTMHGWSRKHLVFDHNQDSQYNLEGKHIETLCEKCHFTTTGDEGFVEIKLVNIGNKCGDCHDDPHKEQFKKRCKECHSEYGWKEPWLADFHGADSSYPLKGLHNKVKCSQCHKLPDKNAKLALAKFAGLSSKCSSCHEDIHKGQISHSCETCHQEHGWKERNLLFVHNQHSEYKIDDLHSLVLCSSCHLPDADKIVQYKPVSMECGQCHTDIADFINGRSPVGNSDADPHDGRVTCIDCHPVNIARQSSTQYARKCASCHNPRYFDLYFDWQKSMAQEIKIALGMIEALDEHDNIESENISKKLKIIEIIGFHNIQLTRKLHEDIFTKYQALIGQNQMMQHILE